MSWSWDENNVFALRCIPVSLLTIRIDTVAAFQEAGKWVWAESVLQFLLYSVLEALYCQLRVENLYLTQGCVYETLWTKKNKMTASQEHKL